ncbi:hypothetical protein RJ639_004781 [Escallonia herrerae]|uniref:Uncharacterized protein n=1 Tax=Escallonia herrerae TaxID=1293975 RepID=A0AA88VYY4_9ASTE|nr:hypothetical protein RJ639_004781 [Escallonia herrerae]
MARQFPLARRLTSTSQAGLAVAGTLFLCAFALFMCANHSPKWRRRWRACYGFLTDEPVMHIQLNNDTVSDAFQSGNGEDESNYNSGEVSVWQKNIIMGGKCQLPDFSGVIIYDSEGNIVAPAKPTLALTWK